MLAGSRDQAAGSRRNGYVCDCHLAGDERASRASARRLTPRSRLGTARAADGGLEPPSLSFLFEIGPADLRLLCVTWTPRPRTPSWRPASCPRGIHPESGGRPRCRQAGPEPVGLRLGPHATTHGDRPPGPLSTRPGPAPLGGQETAGHTRRLKAGPGHRPSHSAPLARCRRQHPKSPTSPELGGVDYVQLTSLPRNG